MNITLLAIVSLWSVNYILLFNHRKDWFKSKYKWYTVSISFVVGLALLLSFKYHAWDINIIFSILMTYLIFSLLDYGFERWSFALHNRDFYLWLRNSSDINNPDVKFKASDRIFSILFVLVILVLPAIPLVLIKMIKDLL
jgi:hypothetical protein